MKKISQQLRDRMILQAQEAKEQGLTKLAEAAFVGVMMPGFGNETNSFNYDELTEVVQHSLWRAATQVAVYHDVFNVDIQKLEPIIKDAADRLIAEIKASYGVKEQFGPFEEKVLGQKE